jgi:hypothetical protein
MTFWSLRNYLDLEQAVKIAQNSLIRVLKDEYKFTIQR